jgi:hemerythrin
VSKLAERSSQSTKEIEALVRESVKSVDEGVTVAESSQGSMEEIRDASQKVKDMIGGLSTAMRQQGSAIAELTAALANIREMSQSISTATGEQAINAKQVSKAVENVTELTQSAASAAEEMSSATEQLAAMAQDLQRSTTQFKIVQGTGDDDNGGSDGSRRHHGHDGNGHNGNGNGTHGGAPAAAVAAVPVAAQALPSPKASPTAPRELFSWSASLGVNVRKIDDQHKRLVAMINELYREMIQKKGLTAQRATIGDMVEYAATHFKEEETYMERFGFEGLAAHRGAHAAFVEKALALKTRSDSDGFILTMEVLEFLKGWLQTHIMGVDRQYMECFSKNGLR